MIRNAKFADIPGIVTLFRDGFRRSHYALDGRCNLDEAELKRLMVQAVQRHGARHGGATWVQIAETDGAITGVILGTLARVYSVFDRLMATDLFWLVSDQCNPADAVKLMKGMIDWARSCPDVVEIKCGTTAIIQDPAAAGKILERLGLKPYGGIYRMEVN